MTTYTIGDIQGCFEPFLRLLQKIKFNSKYDRLLLAGDLVNRGPDSAAVMDYVYKHRSIIQPVLGNHDIHLLRCFYSEMSERRGDTLTEILHAPECEMWLNWLRQQPLLWNEPNTSIWLSHAGIPHIWSLNQAQHYASEAHQYLIASSVHLRDYLLEIFGNTPAQWSDDLQGIERFRCIVNYFTRMRLIDIHGTLNFTHKESEHTLPSNFAPWFRYPLQWPSSTKIIFGHWAALQGKTDDDSIIASDTGCVWGNSLTAIRLDDLQRFSVLAQPE
ncbi:MAG: symmetrical bis(5'-nucleosyl)-tetraphosphatase [Pseudomonadota bacterium]